MSNINSVKLFIASAGLGSRLRPVTNSFPKPLLPLAGLNLIERLVYSVGASCGVKDLGMNLHYLPEKFEAWSEQLNDTLPQRKFFYEKELLGTGGAIDNARDYFSDGSVLLINGDILSDMDWSGLLKEHRASGNMVTLAVQDRAHERRVGIDEQGKLLCIDKEMKTAGVARWMGYACAVVYEPDFLKYVPQGESHVVPYWVEAAEATGRVGTYDIGKAQLLDLGNINTYAEGAFLCLGENERYLAEPLKTPWDLNLRGNCIIETDVEIGRKVSLDNCILLPGAQVSDNEELKNMVIGADFRVPFDYEQSAELKEKFSIGQGGSDRVYYREENAVRLQYSPFELNADRQCILTEALLVKGMRVPEIFEHDKMSRQIRLKDLGDETFRAWRETKPLGESTQMMNRILDQLVDFQFLDIKHASVPQDKTFNEDVLLWESAYFLERCVYRLFNLKDFCESVEVQLSDELKALASEVNNLPRRLMHRDFQSDNIMIHQGDPWFIDFQGAHYGTPFYDAASFIGDPYMLLDSPSRGELESHYLSKVCAKLDMTQVEGQRALILCGLQRHMQALGAYGFLSKIRGKQRFEDYVAPALELLQREVEQVKDEFPVLNRLILKMKTEACI